MKKIDYLKVGKATDLEGKDRQMYRVFEILPGFLSWATLIFLIIFSYFKPIWVAYFIIAFDVYWLLLVIYLGLHLVSAYRELKINSVIDWKKRCLELESNRPDDLPKNCLINQGMLFDDIIHIVLFPTSYEGLDIIRPSIQAVVDSGYDTKKIILVFATEGRAGKESEERAEIIRQEFGKYFRNFLITVHPDGIAGELKGKGANQAWAAKEFREKIVNQENIDYGKILVSVFDIDTIISPGYFHCLTYKFLTVEDPYFASYQPVPFYHNNVWEASFISRVAANSNTFWQMMQQIRYEKLATYSSHSMTFKALSEINFWSTNMVSEDSRITWHCFCFYDGKYRVEPLHFPVSMDATQDANIIKTAKSLYKQQRRWGWGVENLPYLMFNAVKRWKTIDRKKAVGRILVQLHGFHSWATNALIIAVIGWMPMLLGGDKFHSTVLSSNLPMITRTLMMFAMVGLILSAVVSTLLLPKRPAQYGFWKSASMVLQWWVVPITIIFFGAIPGLEAQTRLMFGKYMGFQVTPKGRTSLKESHNWDQK